MSAELASGPPATNVVAFRVPDPVYRAEPICLEIVAACGGDPGRLFAAAVITLNYIDRTRGTAKAIGPQATTNGLSIAMLALAELLGVTVCERGEA